MRIDRTRLAIRMQVGDMRKRWGHWLLLLGCCALWCAAHALNGQFSDVVDTDLYDAILTLTPAAGLSGRAAVQVTLEAGTGNAYTRVTLTKRTVVIEAVGMGSTRPIEVASGVQPGTPYHLTIMRRGGKLGVLHDDAFLFRGEVPRAHGNLAGVVAHDDWSVGDARIQRLEPVVFADNFMRTADESGGWMTQSGRWALQSAWDRDPKGNANRFNNIVYAQNPFAWVNQAEKGPAWCTTGQSFWEDYILTTAVCPATGGTVGVGVNLTDARNGLLVLWTSANDNRSTGNRLALYRLENGQRTLLAEDAGGFVPGQWYQLAVTSTLDQVRVAVDGRERIVRTKLMPWRGAVGLYAEGKIGSVFDDVTVYGRTLKTDLLRERRQVFVNQRYLEDKNGMQEWAADRSDWTTIIGAPNHMVHRDDFFGEYWTALTLKPTDGKTGQLWLVINGDGKDANSGYRAVMQRTEDEAQITGTLYRDTTVLASAKLPPLEVGEEYSLRLRRDRERVWLELDGDSVLEATDRNPLTGMHPGYFAEGCYAGITDQVATGRNVLDYTFADAPVDWVGQGMWRPTVRWSCAPHWSFLGGWGHGDVVLAHKNRFTGDQSFEAFVGLKMEYPREHEIYDNRYRNLGISICGDGSNPRTGYTGIFGAPGVDGVPNSRTVLYRNGVEVATANFMVPGRGSAHREWFDLSLRKYGDVIEFWVEGKLVLTYTDHNPIVGGVPMVCTSDNGISLARVRIHFLNPPQPRNDPRVILDEPWYPEWGNVDQPIVLDFPNAWSTTGKSVHLQAEAKNTPSGEEKAVTVDRMRATFTPHAPGNHWYLISASDGERTSHAFQLTLPVFNPALGRDDTHALALYRFHDGEGSTVVRDTGAVPAGNLVIPAGAPVQWLPGQGLTLQGAVTLATAEPMTKLSAIAETRAATFETWVSTDTLYPPSAWSGCLLTWETAGTQNLTLAHRTAALAFEPNGPNRADVKNASAVFAGFRTGLQHLVITWNGKITSCYVNGVKVGAQPIAWKPEEWLPDARLLLGAFADGQRYYLGTYYLLAIHDTCFTDEQVLRHYNAGPSAQ